MSFLGLYVMFFTKLVWYLAIISSKKKKKCFHLNIAFPGGLDGKESACNAGDLGSIPGLGRSPGGRHGNPPQYSCLENPHGQRSLAGSMGSQRVRHDWVAKHLACYSFWPPVTLAVRPFDNVCRSLRLCWLFLYFSSLCSSGWTISAAIVELITLFSDVACLLEACLMNFSLSVPQVGQFLLLSLN